MSKHPITAENAARMLEWLNTRGGLAIWRSADLSNPGQTWTTPVNGPDGQPTPKQNWRMESAPSRIITDAADVEVCVDKEVKRFRVGILRGSQGLTFKCTDAASRRIRKETEKAGQGAYHTFDYETQEAVIMAPSSVTPLNEWAAAQDAGCAGTPNA